MKKPNLYGLHLFLVRSGKYEAARRLYDLLKFGTVTLGVSKTKSDAELFHHLDGIGVPWSFRERTKETIFRWKRTKKAN